LPFALLHGEALVACAAWGLEGAGVVALDPRASVADVEPGSAVVLHDVLCPMTPPAFIAGCVARSVEEDAVVVGVRPVTDTVKLLLGEDADTVGETVDRDSLVRVASPLVIPPGLVGRVLDVVDDPAVDFVGAVATLRSRAPRLLLEEAPAAAARIGSADDVRVLEALTRP